MCWRLQACLLRPIELHAYIATHASMMTCFNSSQLLGVHKQTNTICPNNAAHKLGQIDDVHGFLTYHQQITNMFYQPLVAWHQSSCWWRIKTEALKHSKTCLVCGKYGQAGAVLELSAVSFCCQLLCMICHGMFAQTRVIFNTNDITVIKYNRCKPLDGASHVCAYRGMEVTWFHYIIAAGFSKSNEYYHKLFTTGKHSYHGHHHVAWHAMMDKITIYDWKHPFVTKVPQVLGWAR